MGIFGLGSIATKQTMRILKIFFGKAGGHEDLNAPFAIKQSTLHAG